SRARRRLRARHEPPRRFSRQLSAGRHGAGRATRPHARGDRTMVESDSPGAAHTACERGGGARSTDVDQGVRPLRQARARDRAASRERCIRASEATELPRKWESSDVGSKDTGSAPPRGRRKKSVNDMQKINHLEKAKW